MRRHVVNGTNSRRVEAHVSGSSSNTEFVVVNVGSVGGDVRVVAVNLRLQTSVSCLTSRSFISDGLRIVRNITCVGANCASVRRNRTSICRNRTSIGGDVRVIAIDLRLQTVVSRFASRCLVSNRLSVCRNRTRIRSDVRVVAIDLRLQTVVSRFASRCLVSNCLRVVSNVTSVASDALTQRHVSALERSDVVIISGNLRLQAVVRSFASRRFVSNGLSVCSVATINVRNSCKWVGTIVDGSVHGQITTHGRVAVYI